MHHEEDEEDGAPRTQSQKHNKTFSDAEHAQHVANAVRYILAADQSKAPITRSAVSKAIECHGAGFRTVMNSAEKVLEEVCILIALSLSLALSLYRIVFIDSFVCLN